MNYIDKFNLFLKNTSESLDTSDIEIKWVDNPTRLVGLFKIGSNVYQLDFNLIGDSWSYKFYYVKEDGNDFILSIDKTGIDTDKFKVISVAKKGLIYMLENKNPNAVIFSAANEIESKNKVKINNFELTKRQHIYQKLSQQITDYFSDYKYIINLVGEDQIYIILKKELINPENTYENIKEIIEKYLT